MRNINSILYAHGLGGSPGSAKAVLIEQHFSKLGIKVFSPSFAVPSLEKLSPLAARELFAAELAIESRHPMAVVASSFGAFIALHALHRVPQEFWPRAVVLLAPVTHPWWGDRALLTPHVEAQWRAQGSLGIMDLARQCEVQVHYRFVEELHALGACSQQIGVPTLLVHGRSDEVVSVEQSRMYAAQHPEVALVTVDDDHALLSQPQHLVALIEGFLGRHVSEARVG
jgi:pimeloyl-ACP methyl ester carboxylesterase